MNKYTLNYKQLQKPTKQDTSAAVIALIYLFTAAVLFAALFAI